MSLPRPTDQEYIYGAKLLRVVDGDTLELSVDLGFGFHRRDRFRLAGADGRLLRARDTEFTRIYIENCLRNAKSLAIKSIRLGTEGDSYAAHVFYSPEELELDECFAEGEHLNAELVETGHSSTQTMSTSLN